MLEAAGARIPLVATNVGGIPEIVENERTGFLVPEATAVALARAIEQARADRVALVRMGHNGRRFVLEQCSIERMCEGYAVAYAAAAGRS